jgi:hypothetical protein
VEGELRRGRSAPRRRLVKGRRGGRAENPRRATGSGKIVAPAPISHLRDASHVGTVEVSRAIVRDISQRRNRMLWPAPRVATAGAKSERAFPQSQC